FPLFKQLPTASPIPSLLSAAILPSIVGNKWSSRGRDAFSCRPFSLGDTFQGPQWERRRCQSWQSWWFARAYLPRQFPLASEYLATLPFECRRFEGTSGSASFDLKSFLDAWMALAPSCRGGAGCNCRMTPPRRW